MIIGSPRAMVVDDSRVMRMILSRTLTEVGYGDIRQAANGREALDQIHAEGAELGLVMLDWNMPEMNGLEFVQRVRAEAQYNAVKIVMVTTETQVDQMVAALEAGANEYVMKPFTKEVLEDKLRLAGVLS
ncbi:MAG: response regulator [Bryobacter sp.]|jgi:two-component system chemotaxis response regulator CheY|nr:response regulator [Bryobacter sp.]